VNDDLGVEKMAPRDIPHVAGAHWTVKLSRVADRVEPYAAKRRKPTPRPLVDRHLPTVKRVGSKVITTGRTKAAETIRSVSYDVSSLNDKDKLIRETASGQGRLRPAVAKSFIPGQGYVKATEAGAEALRRGAKLRSSHGYEATRMGKKGKQRIRFNTATGEVDPNNAVTYRRYLSSMRDAINIHEGQPTRTIQTKRGKITLIQANPGKIDRNALAYAVTLGGRRGERYIVAPADTDAQTLAHEIAHLTPKRSSYRTFQNHLNGKRGSEEARADMTGASYFRIQPGAGEASAHSGYAAAASDPGYQMLSHLVGSGLSPREAGDYRMVQDKIAIARGARIKTEDDKRLGPGQHFYSPAWGYKAPEPKPDFGTPGDAFHGNQYVDWRRRKRRNRAIRYAAGGTVGAGVGVAAYRDHKVNKSYQPWDGIRSEVSKMGPDPSELHVAGSSGQRRGRLRKCPPDAIRRIR